MLSKMTMPGPTMREKFVHILFVVLFVVMTVGTLQVSQCGGGSMDEVEQALHDQANRMGK